MALMVHDECPRDVLSMRAEGEGSAVERDTGSPKDPRALLYSRAKKNCSVDTAADTVARNLFFHAMKRTSLSSGTEMEGEMEGGYERCVPSPSFRSAFCP